jgi:hypothetical protein
MAAAVGVLCGCAAVEATLSPRARDVTVGAGDVRDNVMLLNIVRASRKEPLDFIAISKYTAGGTLGLVSNLGTKAWAPAASFPQSTFGPNNLTAQATNSFDLGTLENHDFYAGVMSQVSASEIHLLLHSGLTPQIVFHALLDSINVTTDSGTTYKFPNDPTDDRWTDATGAREELSARCVELTDQGGSYPSPTGSGYNKPFNSDIWVGDHVRDCRYQKFIYFVRLAFIYGLTTEVTSVPNPAAKTDKTQPKTLPEAQFCFDASLAQNYIRDKNLLCGSKAKRGTGQFIFNGGARIRSVELVWRSTYGVFRYLGTLISTGTIDRVNVSAGVGRLTDDRILTITGPEPCFARTGYDSLLYCVPADGADNTKEIFTLLSSLVALSVSQSALPITPQVILAP